MSPEVLFLLFIVCKCNTLSIGVSDKNMTEHEKDGEFYPDWVPFKNKHGEQLGEFRDVKKTQPKKRLASPLNYVLRAIADEVDDYYDRGQGESDNEDYFEKKEWSDVHRVLPNSSNLSHSDIAGIDNIVSIITKPSDTTILKSIKGHSVRSNDITTTESTKDNINSDEDNSKDEISVDNKERKKITDDMTDYIEDIVIKNDNDSTSTSISTPSDEDDEEASIENTEVNKEKTQIDPINEHEKNEEEANKARILDSVDRLKELHAKEQRYISERVKQEEFFREHRDRNRYRPYEHDNKYSSQGRPQWKNAAIGDEYDEEMELDKYKIKPYQSIVTLTTTQKPTKTTKSKKSNKTKKVVTGKLSVFRNPLLYMINEDDNVITTIKPVVTNKPKRFSAQYSSSDSPMSVDDEYVKISLVPQDLDSKEGEPTLFFPKKIKSRRRSQIKTSMSGPDFLDLLDKDKKAIDVSEISTDTTTKYFDTSLLESEPFTIFSDSSTTNSNTTSLAADTTSTAEDTAPSAADTTSTAEDTAPTVADSVPTAPDTILQYTVSNSNTTDSSHMPLNKNMDKETHYYDKEKVADTAPSGPDSVPSAARIAVRASDTAPSAPEAILSQATSHTSDSSHVNDHHKEKGGGKEHHKEHEKEYEEHGKKVYEEVHKDAKTTKSHHDKEKHQDNYDDHGGVDKHHHEEDGHFGEHHHEEEGKKHAKYEESGKHSKGHSTKGSHDIHKKEEYEKNVEFFEEEGDSSEEEKHGGHHDDKKHSKVAKFKKANLQAEHKGRNKGEKGHFFKGRQGHLQKGMRDTRGYDAHGKHEMEHLRKNALQENNQWVYHHPYPARTANLMVIDRRTDAYQHGPHYYG